MTTAAVSVVDYGIGNIGSVVNACRRVGAAAAVAETGADLRGQAPAAIVLPGVGAIKSALQALRARGFESALQHLVRENGTPFLGICVGMQILAERCHEFGVHQGFGWIAGQVERIVPPSDNVRVPHVGWNDVAVRGADPVLDGLDGAHFYFVHSCALRCNGSVTTASADYGGPFAAAVRDGVVRGVQFHPEKSSGAGEQLLAQFFATCH